MRTRGTITFLTIGEILPRTRSYVPMLMIAGSACLIARWIFHLVAQPKLEPARVNWKRSRTTRSTNGGA